MKTLLIVISAMFLTVAALYYVDALGRRDMAFATAKLVEEPPETFAIREALYQHFGDDANTIQVTYRDHAVALWGTVQLRATKELADEVAMSQEGVRVVHDFIALEPGIVREGAADLITSAELSARDALLESSVKASLASDIGDEALEVSVEACDGVVSLRGELPDEERKLVALQAALNVDGVSRLIDLIHVAA